MSDAIDGKVRRLSVAREFVRLAEEDLQAQLLELFPIGAMVRWKRGHHTQVGLVVRHAYRDNLMVANGRTGATLKISTFDIIQSLPQEAQDHG